MRFRTYALALIFVTVACVAAVGGLNIAVDPYHYFGTAPVEGFNRNKPHAIDQHRIAKTRLLARMEPGTLILGNSRFDVGLDPASPAWPDQAKPVFNLAIPGQGIQQTVEMLGNALAHHQPETVIWGVDFLDFLVDQSAPERDIKPTLPTNLLEHVKEAATVSLSIEGLMDSLATVTAQGAHKPPGIMPNGFNASGTYADIVRSEGHAALFRQKNLTYLQRLTRKDQALAPLGQSTSQAMNAFEQALRDLEDQNIQIILATYPYHADLLEIIHMAGHGPTLNRWQMWLQSVVTGTLARNPNARISLWDYIGYSPITGEQVPVAGDRTSTMTWFWESGHFKRELGDHMLGEIYSGGHPTQALNRPADQWGSAITREQYRSENPAAVARIESLARQIRR